MGTPDQRQGALSVAPAEPDGQASRLLPTCGFCRFFLTAADVAGDEHGECRRRSPRVAGYDDNQWPWVGEYEFGCGEYEPRIVATPTGALTAADWRAKHADLVEELNSARGQVQAAHRERDAAARERDCGLDLHLNALRDALCSVDEAAVSAAFAGLAGSAADATASALRAATALADASVLYSAAVGSARAFAAFSARRALRDALRALRAAAPDETR